MATITTITIGELSRRTGAAASALRFYEDQGLLPAERAPGGQRRYRREAIRRVSFIRAAQQVGLSLREIRAFMAALPDERIPTGEDWAGVADAWRSRLDEQIGLLERLQSRLTGCIGCGCLSMETCPIFNPDDVRGAEGPGPRLLLHD